MELELALLLMGGLLVVMLVYRTVKIVPEHETWEAVGLMGKTRPLKPGLNFLMPFTERPKRLNA